MNNRRPIVTRMVMEGLANAYARMEADDLIDLSDDDNKAFQAAGDWLSRMWEFFQQRDGKEGDDR